MLEPVHESGLFCFWGFFCPGFHPFFGEPYRHRYISSKKNRKSTETRFIDRLLRIFQHFALIPLLLPLLFLSELRASDYRQEWETENDRPFFLDSERTFDLEAVFIYWQPVQGGMDLAIASAALKNPAISPPSYYILSSQGAEIQTVSFEYKPGFALHANFFGLGPSSLGFRYLYFHPIIHTRLDLPPGDERGPPSWSLSNWFGVFYPFTFGAIDSEWKLKLDQLDLLSDWPIAKSEFYELNGYFGLSALLLRQSFRLKTDLVNATINPAISLNFSKSQAIGPLAGAKVSCFLGSGFRVEAGFEAALYQSRFSAEHSDNADLPFGNLNLNFGGTQISLKESYVFPMANFGLGLGYRMSGKNKVAFDVLLDYEFRFMGSQNVMRELMNAYIGANGTANPYSLTFNGLNVKCGIRY